MGKTKKRRGTDISTPAETPKGVTGAMAVTNETTTTKDVPTKDPLNELPKYPDIPSKLEYLTAMIATILSVVMQVRDSINYSQGEINDLKTEVSDLKHTCDESKSEVLKLQCEMRTLKQSYSKTEDRVIRMESQSRRNNLLIDGIAEKENESAKDC